MATHFVLDNGPMIHPVQINIETALFQDIVRALTNALEEIQEQYPEGPERAKFVLASHITIGAMWQHVLGSYPYSIERENILTTALSIRNRFWPPDVAVTPEERS